ncbi:MULTISPECIES: hypothetical protein [Thiorhodovibrio]|uniref:hypothetical protein n=1 Tax=Thiorhodovibrio TaxID=61593 RepID=UPI001913BE61|nr:MULTISPECIES: hypothetical protein [Thiorhodovibrio]MBK5969439.1 hypothetical protein [Thiorhodovibrio winogradskyi]WPL11017.1 hypothetical protein Thiosp_00741 [Thiorhodovibrio litoralis]
MSIHLPLALIALALLLNGCATSGPVGSRQVVTEDGYREADQVVERIPERFTPMSASVLAAEKELPVKFSSGFLLIDDAGAMREKLPAPFDSRAGLASVLARRLKATLVQPGYDGRETSGPVALTAVSLHELDSGWSPKLADGLAALAPRLSATTRNTFSTALIILSRAERVDEAAVRQVAEMRGRFGERLCVHLVTVGDPSACFKLKTFDACGTAVTGASIAEPEAMAAFALRVFYGDPLDSDGDGVANYQDRCPRTGRGTRVNWNGCPFDESRLMKLLPREITEQGWALPPPSSL